MLGEFFTSDKMVLEISSKLLILAGINQISDSLNVVGQVCSEGKVDSELDPFSTLYRITSLPYL